MLEKHAVKERIEFNKELYKKIFSITGKPKKILDLGCGLNPIYFPFKDIYYVAIDINKKVLKKVKNYFRKNKIKGEVFNLDIRDKLLKNIKNVDLILAFKVTDCIKKNELNDIIKNMETKWFVVSVPTRTVSGRRMNKPRRRGFEKILNSLNYKYDIVRFYNELFYIIKKI